ncbi:permease-like cell division protein FtsX [Nesterenkonia alkaliphila]|uniref:Cell division protein FtsX n=1 Tax=Nesterenkonia alkaliphila TaxID=1463631 RepID=A0A7K1UI91_9MICC|nr:permease-like cell division protein FtsX [Nesterenkonia alkaliphila]MVT26169.1 FtsX-like permease family protein [Nesterenkonia alkaliphila]GFZ84206.1 cell division protein FtsX [Nesterenkonia alkaliphila]
MSQLMYQLGETLSSLRKNVAMVASVVLVTFISLSFVGTAALMQLQVNQMTEDFYDRLEISVFLCTENSAEAACPTGAVTDAQRNSIEEMLTTGAASQYVDSFRYESQEEALENFQASREGSIRAENVTAEDMPESFRLLLSDPQDFLLVNELFAGVAGVENVADQQEVLDQVFSILNGLTVVALIIAAVMILCTVLLVSTTIRLSAFSRRRETSIMRMVGASKSMIRTPFIFEGIIAALLGSLLACAATWVVAEFLMGQWLAQQVTGIVFISAADSWIVMPALVLVAVLLAGLSSWLTVRKYLRV